jgi:hypothetical protein
MITYSFLFPPSGLEVLPSADELSNVVYSVSYRIAAIGATHQAYASLKTTLPAPAPAFFIDYANITEAQLIDWLESAEPTMQAVKADLAAQLHELESTPETVMMPLPWTVMP